MKVFLINPLVRLPDNYPTYSFIKGVLDELETVSSATYNDIITTSGNVIRVVNEMTLGEIINFVAVVCLTVTIIFFFLAQKIWSPTK